MGNAFASAPVPEGSGLGQKGFGMRPRHAAQVELLGPALTYRCRLTFSDSDIYPSALAWKPFETRPRKAGFQPSGPVETFVFL